MRTKVISVLAVVILYTSMFILSVGSAPLLEEGVTGLQILAGIGVIAFASLGYALALIRTVNWLLKKDDTNDT